MQVEIRETSANEPLKTRRKDLNIVKIGGAMISRDKLVSYLVTGQVAVGVEGA